MTVDEDRRATAPERRRRIIEALNAGFAPDSSSYLGKFRELVDGPRRTIIANADIDGLVAAQLLSSCTGWKVGAMYDRDGSLLIAPEIGSVEELAELPHLFGVDVFSTLYPSISNHPVLFGASSRTAASVRHALTSFDEHVTAEVQAVGAINLSAWVGIGAMLGSNKPNGMPYKYPLGTAQLALALLERAGLNPTIYDRQFLPWLIANCDGGVDTIRTYAWNAEVWWSALAASVGPASHSEALYQLVITQRPSQFLDADRRLRYEDPSRARYLSTKWNLTGDTRGALKAISGLVEDLSGWPDPFRMGRESLNDWLPVDPTRNLLRVSGITKMPADSLNLHLESARLAGHMNFSIFQERGVALGWALLGTDPAVATALGTTDLVEDLPMDADSIPTEGEEDSSAEEGGVKLF